MSALGADSAVDPRIADGGSTCLNILPASSRPHALLNSSDSEHGLSDTVVGLLQPLLLVISFSKVTLNSLSACCGVRLERLTENGTSASNASWRLAVLYVIYIPDIHLASDGLWDLWVRGTDLGVRRLRIQHPSAILCVGVRRGVPWQADNNVRSH